MIPTSASTVACWRLASMAEIRCNTFLRRASLRAGITAQSAPTGAARLLVFGLGAAIRKASLQLWCSTLVSWTTTLGFAGGWPVITRAQAKAGALTASIFWVPRVPMSTDTNTNSYAYGNADCDANSNADGDSYPSMTPTPTPTAIPTPRVTPRPRPTPRQRPTPP